MKTDGIVQVVQTVSLVTQDIEERVKEKQVNLTDVQSVQLEHIVQQQEVHHVLHVHQVQHVLRVQHQEQHVTSQQPLANGQRQHNCVELQVITITSLIAHNMV